MLSVIGERHLVGIVGSGRGWDGPEQAWMQLDSSGAYSPSERAGWWINFSSSTGERSEMYGPFAEEEEAETYLRWSLEETMLSKFNEPAITFALQTSDVTRIVEVR